MSHLGSVSLIAFDLECHGNKPWTWRQKRRQSGRWANRQTGENGGMQVVEERASEVRGNQ